jgi:DNA repair protein RadD
MELRYYQHECVNAIYEWMRAHSNDNNPCAVLPTGAGKTPVLATLCRDAVLTWGGRVLVVAHVKELLQQAAEKIRLVAPTLRVGVYSAGLGRRETDAPVIVAGIQSVCDKAEDLGRFDLVIVDEAHLIPATGDGMYRTLIEGLRAINDGLWLIGLTATPYRLGSGPICGPDNLLNGICYEAGVKQLMGQGYLCPLTSKKALTPVDLSAVKVERGEFRDDQAEAAFTGSGVVEQAVKEILSYTPLRNSVLIFCQTVEHGNQVAGELRRQLVEINQKVATCLKPARGKFGQSPGIPEWPVIADWLEENGHPVEPLRLALAFNNGHPAVCEIYGDTPKELRASYIDGFKAGRVRYLVNVGVLTTGFDAPNVDCVCLLRATASPGLYYQMVGRGFRLSPGKENCLVLDFGSNVERHGPVDAVKPRAAGKQAEGNEAPAKACPECQEIVAPRVKTCPDCGFVFPVLLAQYSHDGRASDAEPVSGGKGDGDEVSVCGVSYSVHRKKGADESAPKTMRVTYKIDTGTLERRWESEWVCVEHEGFARKKALTWWRKRCAFPMPKSAVEAVTMAEHGMLAEPKTLKLRTRRGERFPEIVGADLGEIPDGPAPCPDCGLVNTRVIVGTEDYGAAGQIRCDQCPHCFGYASQDQVERWGILGQPGKWDKPGMLDFLDLSGVGPPVSDADEELAPVGAAYAEPSADESPF